MDEPRDIDPLAPWPAGSMPVQHMMYYVTLLAACPGLAMAVEVSSYDLHHFREEGYASRPLLEATLCAYSQIS